MGKPDLSDYIDVASRIAAFKEAYPEGSLQSEMIHMNEKVVVFKAYAHRDREDLRPGVGHASEQIPGATPYTRGSEVMVCETSAWGRAIAALGFEVKKGIASREEVFAAQQRQVPADDRLSEAAKAIFDEPVRTAPEGQEEVYDAALKAIRYITPDEDAACPRHKLAWVHRNGTTADGRDYDFWACPAPKSSEGYCKQRPSIAWSNAKKG
jgi:hypothetical protein